MLGEGAVDVQCAAGDGGAAAASSALALPGLAPPAGRQPWSGRELLALGRLQDDLAVARSPRCTCWHRGCRALKSETVVSVKLGRRRGEARAGPRADGIGCGIGRGVGGDHPVVVGGVRREAGELDAVRGRQARAALMSSRASPGWCRSRHASQRPRRVPGDVGRAVARSRGRRRWRSPERCCRPRRSPRSCRPSASKKAYSVPLIVWVVVVTGEPLRVDPGQLRRPTSWSGPSPAGRWRPRRGRW